MKKVLTLLLIALLLTVMCSCDVQKVLDNLSRKTEPIILLDLDASDSRGMTMMPKDVPFLNVRGGMEPIFPGDETPYGFWTSCFVLRSLPIFPGITSINASAEGLCNSLKDKEFNGFGFPMKVVKAEKTDDGVFLLYNIYEKERVFGQIEYYYSTKNKTFSYREIVTPLLGIMGADNIFIFELMNVPVEKDGNGLSFKAGEIYENGSSFNYYNINFSPSGSTNLDVVSDIYFDHQRITMNYNNYAVDSASFWTKNKRVNLNETIDFTVLGRDNTLNLKETLVFLKDFFESPVLKENYEYDTIDDFNDSALKVSIDWDGAQTLERLSFPISFNLKEKIAACVIIGENLNINNFVYGDEAFSPMSTFIKERFIEAGFDMTGVDIYADTQEKQKESFDYFVQELLKKLDLESKIKDREKFLKDSYNPPLLPW